MAFGHQTKIKRDKLSLCSLVSRRRKKHVTFFVILTLLPITTTTATLQINVNHPHNTARPHAPVQRNSFRLQHTFLSSFKILSSPSFPPTAPPLPRTSISVSTNIHINFPKILFTKYQNFRHFIDTPFRRGCWTIMTSHIHDVREQLLFSTFKPQLRNYPRLNFWAHFSPFS